MQVQGQTKAQTRHGLRDCVIARLYSLGTRPQKIISLQKQPPTFNNFCFCFSIHSPLQISSFCCPPSHCFCNSSPLLTSITIMANSPHGGELKYVPLSPATATATASFTGLQTPPETSSQEIYLAMPNSPLKQRLFLLSSSLKDNSAIWN